MAVNWNDLRRQVDATIETTGTALVLCHDNGEPVEDSPLLPPPISMEARDTRLGAGELSLTLPAVGTRGQALPFVDYLVDKKLGVYDERGLIKPQTDELYMVTVCRRGQRLTYFIPDREASGVESPETVTIEGMHLVTGLQFLPCPSVPKTWLPRFEQWDQDAAGMYHTPRTYAPVEIATKADGYTATGPAERTIQRLIQDSLDAVNTAYGWGDDPAYVVDMTSTGRVSPVVNIRVTDDSIWDTVAPVAMLAGVDIDVDMWWPGDDPVLVRTGRSPEEVTLTSWAKPVGIVKVRQNERN